MFHTPTTPRRNGQSRSNSDRRSFLPEENSCFRWGLICKQRHRPIIGRLRERREVIRKVSLISRWTWLMVPPLPSIQLFSSDRLSILSVRQPGSRSCPWLAIHECQISRASWSSHQLRWRSNCRYDQSLGHLILTTPPVGGRFCTVMKTPLGVDCIANSWQK
jgi:hypothetical protein